MCCVRTAGVIRETRMANLDLFRQRANECRCFPAAACNASDEAFLAGIG
jgi:hypothetical protein